MQLLEKTIRRGKTPKRIQCIKFYNGAQLKSVETYRKSFKSLQEDEEKYQRTTPRTGTRASSSTNPREHGNVHPKRHSFFSEVLASQNPIKGTTIGQLFAKMT